MHQGPPLARLPASFSCGRLLCDHTCTAIKQHAHHASHILCRRSNSFRRQWSDPRIACSHRFAAHRPVNISHRFARGRRPTCRNSRQRCCHLWNDRNVWWHLLQRHCTRWSRNENRGHRDSRTRPNVDARIPRRNHAIHCRWLATHGRLRLLRG